MLSRGIRSEAERLHERSESGALVVPVATVAGSAEFVEGGFSPDQSIRPDVSDFGSHRTGSARSGSSLRVRRWESDGPTRDSFRVDSSIIVSREKPIISFVPSAATAA
jgi:hypothetical protein